jgi:hypothetical protein
MGHYDDRYYLLIRLPELSALQFNRLVTDYAVQDSPYTCRYTVDPDDGLSRFAILKFDGFSFGGDEPAIFRQKLESVSRRLRRQQFRAILSGAYSSYFPDEDHDGVFTLVFSDRRFTLDKGL